MVAPFLAEWALTSPPPPVSLVECRACGHRTYDRVWDGGELARIYGRYRSEAYFEARHRHEPWYTRAVHDGLGGDAATVAHRQGYLARILGRRVPMPVASVLDFGGDRGQFIPPEVASDRFVHELSDAAPVAGVTRLATEADIAAHGPFPLVLACHVLEHQPDPAITLADLRRWVAPGGWLLVEVPYERPALHHRGTGRVAPLPSRSPPCVGSTRSTRCTSGRSTGCFLRSRSPGYTSTSSSTRRRR